MCEFVRHQVDNRLFTKIEIREKDLSVGHRGRGYVLHTAELELGNDGLVVFVDGAVPGDVVALESPTYFGFLDLLESLGLRVLA